MPERVLKFNPAKSDTATLVDKAAALKEEIAAATNELKEINLVLAEKAEFKPGSKTGHLTGRHYQAKIQLKEYTKWDQELLEKARKKMGDTEFFKVFRWTFEPKSAKTLAGALEFGSHAKIIESARTVTDGAPYITFEMME